MGRVDRARLFPWLPVGLVWLIVACGPTAPDRPRSNVRSVQIVPPSATVSTGSEIPLSAVARDDSGAIVMGSEVLWASEDPDLATVTTSGHVIGLREGGPVTITATVDSVQGSAELTVTSRPPEPAYVYPLAVDSSGRYLVDRRGRPFLMVGDAAWSLATQLSTEEADRYLSKRAQLGFNVVMVNLLERHFSAYAPNNIYNDPPFTGALFSTPNEAYFSRFDQTVRSAAEKGIVVLLAPLYLGYECGPQGWCAEVRNAPDSALASWGRYVGTRYRSFDNIMWLIGGDMDPTPVQDKVRIFTEAVRAADPRHLMTAHNAPHQMAVTPWPGEDWLGVNNVYAYGTRLDKGLEDAYRVEPPMPFFLIESYYENTKDTPDRLLRPESYTAVLSGGVGHIFGQCPVWEFSAPTMPEGCRATAWEPQLFSQGSLNMLYFQRLFRSRHWYTLVPDLDHRVVTDGFGDFGNTNSFAPAAYASDGSSIIAYLPSSRTVTVNGSVLAGDTATAWWYDPVDGGTTPAGTFPTTGPYALTPPAPGDWVLVVDGGAFPFAAPGTQPADVTQWN